MDDVRVYLDGVLVDVEPSTNIVENRQINSVFSLQDRQVSYTKNFNILLTGETLKAFDFVGKNYNTSDVPYKVLDLKVYRNSSCTITDGYFKVKEIITKEDKELCVLRGNAVFGNYGLFSEIEGKKLSNLDFNSLNHQLNDAAIKASWSNSTGYVYAIANYGYSKPDNELVDIRYIAPSVYWSWLWDKIFEESGYTYEYSGRLNYNPFTSLHFKTKALTVENHPIDFTKENINYTPNVDFSKLFTSGQKDFILEVCRTYGLIFKKDKNRNHYRFIMMEDLLSNKRDAVDLSEKFNITKSEKYSLGSYSKINRLKYKYDEKNESTYDSFMLLLNDTLKKESVIIQSRYKAPVQVNDRFYMEFLEYKFDKDRNLDIKNKKNTSFVINITKSDKAYANFDGLDWDYLINNYYPHLYGVLDKPKAQINTMELTAMDVSNIDFFKLVYLKQKQAYYYLNKIINYTGGKKTDVEMIQVGKPKDNVLRVVADPDYLDLSAGYSEVYLNATIYNTYDIVSIRWEQITTAFPQPDITRPYNFVTDSVIINNSNNLYATIDSLSTSYSFYPFAVYVFKITVRDIKGNIATDIMRIMHGFVT